VIRTLRERWSLGAPLTNRDAIAADLSPILSLDRPRPPEQWPDVVPRLVPPFDVALLPPDLPLSVLGKGLFFGILECEKMLGAKVPDIPKDTDITGAQAVDVMRSMAFNLFPRLRS
jgi:phospholipase C